MTKDIKTFLERLVDERTANTITFEVKGSKKFKGLLDQDIDDVLEDMAIVEFIRNAPTSTPTANKTRTRGR